MEKNFRGKNIMGKKFGKLLLWEKNMEIFIRETDFMEKNTVPLLHKLSLGGQFEGFWDSSTTFSRFLDFFSNRRSIWDRIGVISKGYSENKPRGILRAFEISLALFQEFSYWKKSEKSWKSGGRISKAPKMSSGA